jgi:hypothetical protein
LIKRPKEVKMDKKDNKERRKEVDLYNPKFVHFEWSEDLKDKEGFCGDLIDELRADVRNNGVIGLCDRIGDSGFPFHISFPFHIEDNDIYRFFYYDPHYKIKWAYFKEGKNIQFKSECDGEWEDIRPWSETVVVDGPEYFDNGFEYRIKPEEPKPEVEVNVDVKVNNTSSDGKIKITINGKECVFENAEQARAVLKEN